MNILTEDQIENLPIEERAKFKYKVYTINTYNIGYGYIVAAALDKVDLIKVLCNFKKYRGGLPKIDSTISYHGRMSDKRGIVMYRVDNKLTKLTGEQDE